VCRQDEYFTPLYRLQCIVNFPRSCLGRLSRDGCCSTHLMRAVSRFLPSSGENVAVHVLRTGKGERPDRGPLQYCYSSSTATPLGPIEPAWNWAQDKGGNGEPSKAFRSNLWATNLQIRGPLRLVFLFDWSMKQTRSQLQKECLRTLQCYVRVLQQGCDLLGQVKERFITENERDEIFSHRKQEVCAHCAYTNARKRLWSFLTASESRWPDE
jgi:hypothetical protein